MRVPGLITFLALVVRAAPVAAAEDLLVLTKDDFKSVTAKGVWFVEHFSPYCGHCKHFEPTWRDLVKDIEGRADPGVHLAQVNCVVSGDLCDENKVTGYPTLNLYRDGQFVESYRKNRDLSLLLEYLALHAEPEHPVAPSPPPPAAHDVDDLPATPRTTYNPSGTVLTLTNANYDSTLAAGGPIFIKYYAPWCGHCKKLAPHWTRLAAHARGKMTVAEVDCDAHKALCSKAGVEGYPALYFYPSPGAQHAEYLGGRKFEQLSAFADKATEPPVRTIQDGDFDAQLKEHEVLFLFVQTSTDAASLNTLMVAAQSLLGSAPILMSTSGSLGSRFNVPAGSAAPSTLLVFKDHEATPAATLTLSGSTAQAAVTAWLHANKFPSALELVADVFQGVMSAPHAPLVVLSAVPPADAPGHAGAVAQVHEAAKQWARSPEATARPGQHVQFVWMDAVRWKSWLKGQYGLKGADLPETVLVRHKELIYWDVDAFGRPLALTPASLFATVGSVLDGHLPSKYSEGRLARFAHILSARLQWVESMLFSSIWRGLAVLGAVIALMVWGLLRALDDPVPLDAQQRVDVGGEKKRTGRAD